MADAVQRLLPSPPRLCLLGHHGFSALILGVSTTQPCLERSGMAEPRAGGRGQGQQGSLLHDLPEKSPPHKSPD